MATAPIAHDPSRALRAYVLPVLTLILFLAAVWAVHRELAAWRLTDVTAAIAAVPAWALAAAILAAASGYALLALYDVVGIHYLGHPLPARRAALAGFVGYAFSHTIGLPLLTG